MYNTLSASLVKIAVSGRRCCCCCCRIILAFGRVIPVLDNQTDAAAATEINIIIIATVATIHCGQLSHFLPFLFLLLFMMLVVVSWN
jgi:hypothetical protein